MSTFAPISTTAGGHDLPADPRLRVVRAVFRMMLSSIFVVAGLNHLFNTAGVARRLAEAPLAKLATMFAPPGALVLLAGLGLLAGGVALMVGLQTRVAALLLIALLVPITITVQVGSLATLGPLFKNVGLAGGLLFFVFHGADGLSLDAVLESRTARRGA